MFEYVFSFSTITDVSENLSLILTYFTPMLHFYTPWKRGIEMEHWVKMG